VSPGPGAYRERTAGIPFHACAFQPAYIPPLQGAVSRTPAYRLTYRLTSWLYFLLHRLAPSHTTTTEHLGRAMIAVVHLQGSPPAVLPATSKAAFSLCCPAPTSTGWEPSSGERCPEGNSDE
jgi:hypothetical protein